jgi:hypothetical protein
VETALVFDDRGQTLHWHLPANRSAGYLPDSAFLWQFLWENRKHLGGVAHTHPWDGLAQPSATDLSTFAAIESGLGRRLIWPILTFTETVYAEWVGPGALAYTVGYKSWVGFELPHELLVQLRDLSR